MAERELGESSRDDCDGVHTAGSTIQDLDGGKQWEEEGHQRLTAKAAFFNADNEVVASTDLGWLQLAFDFLTGLFDWVRLRTKVRKTMGVVFWPFRAVGVRAEKSYIRRMTGEGRSFK